MSTARSAETDTGRPVRTAARLMGVVFLLVGVLGFVPGVTTDFDQLQFAGHDSGAMLLGLFAVSVLHNIVHLLFGIAGIAMSRQARTARDYLVYGGIIYAVLWIYGLVIEPTSSANFVPLNNADNWLHLVLAIVMIALGLLLGRDGARRAGTRPSTP
jgi:arginine exporter protein ArgO